MKAIIVNTFAKQTVVGLEQMGRINDCAAASFKMSANNNFFGFIVHCLQFLSQTSMCRHSSTGTTLEYKAIDF